MIQPPLVGQSFAYPIDSRLSMKTSISASPRACDWTTSPRCPQVCLLVTLSSSRNRKKLPRKKIFRPPCYIAVRRMPSGLEFRPPRCV